MQVIAVSPDEYDHPSQSLFGIMPIARELQSHGISLKDFFSGSGVDPDRLTDTDARVSLRQRLILFRNASQLSPVPETALLAGRRQRLSDFGVYGYAFASCATLRDAVLFSTRNMSVACPILQVRFRTDKDGVVLSSHGGSPLGELLPFVAEYWRASMVTLIDRALEGQAISRLMTFPYSAPPHWRLYADFFRCPVEFGAESMEWHFDDAALSQPLPDANPVNAGLLEAACARLGRATRGATGLERRIRTICEQASAIPTAAAMAETLGLSSRSMFRRLAEQATSYQLIIDDVRRSSAMDLLRDRSRPLDEIAQRLGFTEPSNFSKAFRRWTGITPGEYRHRCVELKPANELN